MAFDTTDVLRLGCNTLSSCEKAKVKLLGVDSAKQGKAPKLFVIETERGSKAVVGASKLCEIAKRLNLCLENFDCSTIISGAKQP